MANVEVYDVTLRQLGELLGRYLFASTEHQRSWAVGDWLIVSSHSWFGDPCRIVDVECLFSSEREAFDYFDTMLYLRRSLPERCGLGYDYEVWRIVEEAPEPADLYVMSFLDRDGRIVREEVFSDRGEWVECGACSVMEYDWTDERTVKGWTDYHGNTYDVHVVYMLPCPVAAC